QPLPHQVRSASAPAVAVCQTSVRAGLPGVRAARRDSYGQWAAVLVADFGWALTPGGLVESLGHPSGAHQARAAGPESPARADAPYAEARSGGRRPLRLRRAAEALRYLAQGVQRGAASRGARPGAAGAALSGVATPVSRRGAGADVSGTLRNQ